MKKDSYNRKRLNVANQDHFRLERDILFSATDRYTDAYRCIVTARPIRERFVISLMMTHEPVQSIVYSNFWTYTDRNRCENRYNQIVSITEGARDFIEKEGLKTIVAQYMLKHSLSIVPADVENMYETGIPYIRNTIDKSTRGNILKNIPTVPFLTQSGPDQLEKVYKSTGIAENPVPEDDVPSRAIYQHVQDGMIPMRSSVSSPPPSFPTTGTGTDQAQRRNVYQGMAQPQGSPLPQMPGGMSPMQLSGVRNVIVINQRTAGTNPTETLAEVSKRSVLDGRKSAIRHYERLAGVSREVAEKFYDSVKKTCSSPKVVMKISAEEMLGFMAGARADFLNADKYNAKRDKIVSKLLGVDKSPMIASVNMVPVADKGYYSMVLSPLPQVVLFSGDLVESVNPGSSYHSTCPEKLLYDVGDIGDCKAASAIRALTSRDVVSGPDVLLGNIANGSDRGTCGAFILSDISPSNVTEIVANNDDEAKKARRILDKMSKIMLVSVGKNDVEETVIEAPEPPARKPDAEQVHFMPSDRVAPKPRLNNPSLGTITDTSNGCVTVQWDKGERHVYDMAEALMRLVSVSDMPKKTEGIVTYLLPGMDDDSAVTLANLGIDPVTIYSMASHANPSSDSAQGWQETLKQSLKPIGITASMTNGYVRSDGPRAFVSREWVEARLPGGNRLVFDLKSSAMTIRAGRVPDYVLPAQKVVFE